MLKNTMVSDRGSFDDLALAQMGPLYNMAVRLTRKPEDAEELVQEALLRAYRFFDSWEQGTNFKAWMFRILSNTFINHYRRAKSRPLHVELDPFEEKLDLLAPGSPTDASGFSTDPERIFMEGVVDAEITEALEAMPVTYRMVFLLSVLEELSYKEIASALSIPIGTVMSRLHRARRFLQTRLMEYARTRRLVEQVV